MNEALKKSSEKLRQEMLDDISKEEFDNFLEKYQGQVRNIIKQDSEIELGSFREIAFEFESSLARETSLKWGYGRGFVLLLLGFLVEGLSEHSFLSAMILCVGAERLVHQSDRIKVDRDETVARVELILKKEITGE